MHQLSVVLNLEDSPARCPSSGGVPRSQPAVIPESSRGSLLRTIIYRSMR